MTRSQGIEGGILNAVKLRDTRIVYEHVDDAGIATDDLPKRPGYAARIGHIDAEGSGVHPLLAQIGFGRFRQCAIAIYNRHSCAFATEQTRHLEPHSGATPRDDHILVG
jgi:hypothetical protein